MLQRLKSAFPVFLLALLVQVFAPMVARLEMTALAGPSQTLTICSHSNALGDRQGPGGDHQPATCCDFCQIANSSALPLAPSEFSFVAPTNPIRHIDWASVVDAAPARIYENRAQARAPPLPA